MNASHQMGDPHVPGSERSVVGRMLQFYERRREQILYLAVGGWNTLRCSATGCGRSWSICCTTTSTTSSYRGRSPS